MKNIRYIICLLTFILVSCEMKEGLLLPDNKEGKVQVVARIMPFVDRDVTTKTPKTDLEGKPKTMVMAVFDSDNKCVLYRKSSTGETIFAIDRGNDENSGDFIGADQAALKNCNIYLIANFPEFDNDETLGVGSDLSAFADIVHKVQGITMPDTGLPMLGYYNGVDLSLDSTVDGSKPLSVEMRSLFAKVAFHIVVEANQSIDDMDKPQFRLDRWEVHNVVAEVDNLGGNPSASGDADGTNDKTSLIMSGSAPRVFAQRVEGNNTAQHGIGNSSIDFDFYLPERFLQPKTAANSYNYPFRQDGGSVREEDKRLMQRYKPELAQDNATFVRLIGVFRNHQEHNFDVTYDIYLGSDNYGNFDIVRNTLYTNEITIRDIENSNDQTGVEGAVSVDHRVDVQHSKPIVIKLRRETLLDSHFEVRPMRLYENTDYGDHSFPDNFAVKVEVLNENGTDVNRPSWIRVERSFGNGGTSGNASLYCTEGSAAGKRRYFTENLVSGTGSGTNSLVNSTSVIVPVTEGMDQCVWIYADEVTYDADNESGTVGKEATRRALVRVSYGTYDGTTFTPIDDDEELKPVDYVISQALLYPVETKRSEWSTGASFNQEYTYYIEYEEEYLYNFDNEDTFDSNPVFDDGMEWGLDGIQLSHQHKALYLEVPASILGSYASNNYTAAEVTTTVNEALKGKGIDPKYDFYLMRDTDNENLEIRNFVGHTFNKEMIVYLLENYPNEEKAKLNKIAMDERAKSAIAYCYNKNKRNENGDVVYRGADGNWNTDNLKWYLPAIDEIEDIAEFAYQFKGGVFQGNMYWSCQPSYISNYIYMLKYSWVVGIFQFGPSQWQYRPNGNYGDGPFDGYYYIDDVDNARATRALSENSTFVGAPSSGSDLYKQQNGILYLSAGVDSFGNSEAKAMNETVSMTGESILNQNYKDISKHPGNKPRTGSGKDSWARVRCVYKP